MFQRPTYVDMSQLNQRFHNWTPLTGLGGAGAGALGGSALGNALGATTEYPPLLVTKWFHVPTATWQQMNEAQQAEMIRQAQAQESGYQASLGRARAAQQNAYDRTLNLSGTAGATMSAAVSSAESAVLAAKKCDRASMEQLIAYSEGVTGQARGLEQQAHTAAQECADVASSFPNEPDIVQRATGAIDAANQASTQLDQADGARGRAVAGARAALATCGAAPVPVETCGQAGQKCPCCDGFDCIGGQCVPHVVAPQASHAGLLWLGIGTVVAGLIYTAVKKKRG